MANGAGTMRTKLKPTSNIQPNSGNADAVNSKLTVFELGAPTDAAAGLGAPQLAQNACSYSISAPQLPQCMA